MMNVILTYVIAVSFLNVVHLVFSVFIADMAKQKEYKTKQKEYKTTGQRVVQDFKIWYSPKLSAHSGLYSHVDLL